MAAVLAVLVAHGADPAAQVRQRVIGEGFVSEGIHDSHITERITSTKSSAVACAGGFSVPVSP